MLSDNIRYYRKENKMSQDELAERLGVSRQSISLWENGQTQPTIDNIIALAKIFHVSSDEILKCDDSAKPPVPEKPLKTEQEAKKLKPWMLAVIIGLAVLIGAGSVALVLTAEPANSSPLAGSEGVSAETVSSTSSAFQTGSVAAKAAAGKATVSSNKNAAPTAGAKSTTGGSAAKAKSSAAAVSSASKKIDIFAYCKSFAIEKGHLNGDYSIYQQPSSRYGGNSNEYFSISYWGDSNMVEICLHCPLNETYSENFYLRMRGGYNKKYEYLTSRYYRDNGESVRSATGTIDPAVFSDKYPLNCTKYEGSADGQNDFMEESRVGMCDLIHCLKKFVEVENMKCTFADFEFVHF